MQQVDTTGTSARSGIVVMFCDLKVLIGEDGVRPQVARRNRTV
jgi:hypothetical protein